MAPKVASRQAQGGPKGLKGISKPPPRQLKIIEKSTWDPTRVKRGSPAGSRGAPGRENYTKIDLNATISMPTEKKSEHFVLYLRHFCGLGRSPNRRHSPTLNKNVMSCSVACIRYSPSFAMPSSRGGRSEAQQNAPRQGSALAFNGVPDHS